MGVHVVESSLLESPNHLSSWSYTKILLFIWQVKANNSYFSLLYILSLRRGDFLWYVYVIGCRYEFSQESCWLFSSITLHLTPLRQGLSLNLKFTVYIGLAGQSPWDLPTSATSPASARITYTPAIPRFYMGSEDLNSGPQACTPKTYMHWTISSTPHFVKKKKKVSPNTQHESIFHLNSFSHQLFPRPLSNHPTSLYKSQPLINTQGSHSCHPY